MTLVIRTATPEDMRFVVRSFLDSLREERCAGLIAMEDWQVVMDPQARKLFARPGAEVLVAYEASSDNDNDIDNSHPLADIYGWLAHERGHPWPYVTYSYVKSPYRRMGICTRLMDRAGIAWSDAFRHAVWMHARIAAKAPRAKWAPLIVRYRREHEQGQGRARGPTAAAQPRADRAGGGALHPVRQRP